MSLSLEAESGRLRGVAGPRSRTRNVVGCRGRTYALAVMLRVRLLGGLEVDSGVAGVGVPAGRPARLLLGWLAAFPGEHARAEAAARLWPDVLDSSARASLRTALSDLRAALGPAAVHVRATRETVGAWRAGPVGRPARFSELVAADRREEALALCRGELLEGLDEEWVFELRSRHARRASGRGALRWYARRGRRVMPARRWRGPAGWPRGSRWTRRPSAS